MIIQPGEPARPERLGCTEWSCRGRRTWMRSAASSPTPSSTCRHPGGSSRIQTPAGRSSPRYFRLYVEDALANGVVHTTPDRAAVALWLRAGHRPATQPDGYGERLAAVAGPRTGRFLAFDEALDRTTPPAAPITTWPSLRCGRTGRGRGAAPRCCAHTTGCLTVTLPGPPTSKPPTCAPASCTSARLHRPRTPDPAA